MYYVTEEQITLFLDAIQKLNVNASNDFQAADAWVGLYLAIGNLRQQKIPDKAEENTEEAKE